MSKKLIVVDMQNDFCKPGGVLYNPDAEAIIPNIKKRLDCYMSDDIWFTLDTHYNKYYADSIEGKTLPIHCVNNSNGHAIVEEFTDYIRNTITKSTFARTCWELSFYNETIEEIELCGVCTDICVISNALALRSLYPNANIIIHADCCAGLTPEAHEAALKVMESCLIEVIR